tara:strand:+ start:1040 stop:1321 length:282 start_codon:yes stop_codon:yes gene_type:complete
MKYFIKKLKLPLEIQDKIYSFLDYTECIKNLNRIWYKRLITRDYYYYSKWCAVGLKNDYFINLCLKREEKGLHILLNQGAHNIIDNIHQSHLL